MKVGNSRKSGSSKKRLRTLGPTSLAAPGLPARVGSYLSSPGGAFRGRLSPIEF